MVPYPRNEFFTGREAILETLHTALRAGKATALTQAISGLGGIGKTQTAIEYAYRYGPEYTAVLWIRADSQADVVQSLVTMATLLGLPEAQDPNTEVVVAAVLRWLAQHSGWLLIADNADFTPQWRPEDLKKRLPYPLQGSLLLTSRAQYFGPLGIPRPLELHKMTPEEADAFLWQRVGRDREKTSSAEQQAAQQVAEALDYLPLALEQAGAYVAAKQKRFAGYQDEFQKRAKALLSEVRPEMGEYHPHGEDKEYHTVWTTWDLNFQAIRKENKASAELLQVSAFLTPDAIPAELLIEGATELQGRLAAAFAADRDGMEVYDDLLEPLTHYSLVDKEIEDRTYSLHRLVQKVLQERLSESERKRIWQKVVLAVNRAFPDPEFPVWPLCERLLPHALLCAQYIIDDGLRIAQASRLLHNTGWYLQERARYAEAERLLRESLAIGRQLYSEAHPNIAAFLNSLGLLLKDMGEYDEAAAALEEAVEIDRKTIGEDHSRFAIHLDNLASVYNRQGRNEEAARLGEQALEITRRHHGAEHADVAIRLNNLANVYSSMGHYEKAVSLLEEAMAIDRKTIGENHPEYATRLLNLASVYILWGHLTEAEPFLQQALSLCEQIFGSEHPDTASCYYWLGNLRYRQGRQDEAADYFRRALEIWERTLGPEHPDTVNTREWLAGVT